DVVNRVKSRSVVLPGCWAGYRAAGYRAAVFTLCPPAVGRRIVSICPLAEMQPTGKNWTYARKSTAQLRRRFEQLNSRSVGLGNCWAGCLVLAGCVSQRVVRRKILRVNPLRS